ncbi:hypothetical protein C8R43DRAFT_940824 [Mycena crocata]|nr:hypothetical protein C8R43DRAFT_940824 [Mycena crocata]
MPPITTAPGLESSTTARSHGVGGDPHLMHWALVGPFKLGTPNDVLGLSSARAGPKFLAGSQDLPSSLLCISWLVVPLATNSVVWAGRADRAEAQNGHVNGAVTFVCMQATMFQRLQHNAEMIFKSAKSGDRWMAVYKGRTKTFSTGFVTQVIANVELKTRELKTQTQVVRNLSGAPDLSGKEELNFCGGHLKHLTTVTSLMLDGMYHACAPWEDFMCGFENVTELNLHFHLTWNSNCVLGMIHTFPSLRRLNAVSLSPVIFWTGKAPPPTINIPPHYLTPPPHLHNITTNGKSAHSIFAWLKWYNCPERVDTLELWPVLPRDKA